MLILHLEVLGDQRYLVGVKHLGIISIECPGEAKEVTSGAQRVITKKFYKD